MSAGDPREITEAAIDVYELVEQERTVVSGGGIDAAAHRGTLNASGLTAAAFACYVDKP